MIPLSNKFSKISGKHQNQILAENNSESIFVYGTGSVGNDVWKLLNAKGFALKGFMDHRGTQSNLVGTNIYLPQDERISKEERKNSSVIIAIHNRDANISLILENLRALKYRGIITLIDLYDRFPSELGERYWLTSRDFYSRFPDSIRSAHDLLADQTSRDIYNRLIQFRLSGDYSLLPQPDLEHQYFPADIPAWKTPLRLVDCGAFDGDTLKNFITANISIEAVAAFEPDLINFRKLSQFVKENQNHLPHTSLWPCGVFSSTTQLHFATGRGESSNITNAGESTLQCISLDEAISTFTPNLIKMDIEGAEVEALRGAQYILQEARPGLAISVYHRPEHLWEIPLLIERLMRGSYQYYLRSHGFNDFDIVLYAIPV